MFHSDPSARQRQQEQRPTHHVPLDTYRPNSYPYSNDNGSGNGDSLQQQQQQYVYESSWREPGPSRYYEQYDMDRSYNPYNDGGIDAGPNPNQRYYALRSSPEKRGRYEDESYRPTSAYVPPHQRQDPADVVGYSERHYSSAPAPAPTNHSNSLRADFAPHLPPFPPNFRPYVPPHLQEWNGGRRELSSYSASHSPPRARSRYSTPPPPPVQLPPAEYLALSRPTPESISSSHGKITPKLLVLDLNGALVYRNKSGSLRKPYPRPYLSCFLQYLFLPEPDADAGVREGLGEAGPRPWEVFVWSSAQPHNVRAMVEGAFGNRWIEGIWEGETKKGNKAREHGEGRLLGVWARDKMGLNQADYSRKVQTTKDLRKVIDHFRSPTDENTPRRDYDEKTIVLLDDSPLKAVFQPWNQIVIPEYDKQEYQDSKAAAADGDEEGPNGAGMDRILLAVVGILDELRTVANIPAWIRNGGLYLGSSSEHTPDHAMGGDDQPSLDSLPTHESFVHWYKDPVTFALWIDRGKDALARKGIDLTHGLGLDLDLEMLVPSSSAHPSGSSSTPVPCGVKVEGPNARSRSPQQPTRGWSPSRPNSPYSYSGEEMESPEKAQARMEEEDRQVQRLLSPETDKMNLDNDIDIDIDQHEFADEQSSDASVTDPASGPAGNALKPTTRLQDQTRQKRDVQDSQDSSGQGSWRSLKSEDVVRYLDEIVEGHRNKVTRVQRLQLRAARDIVERLGGAVNGAHPNPDGSTSTSRSISGPGSGSTSTPNSRAGASATASATPTSTVGSAGAGTGAITSAIAEGGGGGGSGSGNGGGKTRSKKYKMDKFKKELQAAKALQPNLTRREFQKQQKALAKASK